MTPINRVVASLALVVTVNAEFPCGNYNMESVGPDAVCGASQDACTQTTCCRDGPTAAPTAAPTAMPTAAPTPMPPTYAPTPMPPTSAPTPMPTPAFMCSDYVVTGASLANRD